MKKAYFLTDLHLGASYLEDAHALERKVVEFLDSIKDSASEIYLLGDILDYWYEYKTVVPRGYVRFFGKLAELSDHGVKITWMIGNHDIWIFDYLPAELGIEVVDGVLDTEILGTPFSLQHGDAIGGNRKFRFMRSMFRNRFCQFLYAGIHPRWTVNFAGNCSRKSRLQKGMVLKWPTNLKEKIKDYCIQRIDRGDKAKYFVFGHLHRKEDMELPEGRRMIILPAWPENYTYATFDGKEFRFQEWKS